jgi:hypothetical protein
MSLRGDSRSSHARVAISSQEAQWKGAGRKAKASVQKEVMVGQTAPTDG